MAAALTSAEAARLSAEIGAELDNVSRVKAEVLSRRADVDDTTTYAIALLLMNYYTGVERIFQRIAAPLGGVPRGDRWHAQLLDDMALDIDGIRPAVVRKQTVEGLSELLRFRHVVRSLYAWTLRRTDLDALVANLESLDSELSKDLSSFRDFLRALATA